MTTFRDIIDEAASRTNLCPRKRDLQADILVSARNILQGIFQEYSNNNLITAYQSAVDFVPSNQVVFAGEGQDIDVYAPKIQTPMSVLYRQGEDYFTLSFVSFAQFYSGGYGDFSVSWQPFGKNQFKIYFKPRFIMQTRDCKMIYNVEMEFTDNDVISLPTPYIELLTRALAYKLCVAFPRVDAGKQNALKLELEELRSQLMAANANQRIITRDQGSSTLMSNFMAGRFI